MVQRAGICIAGGAVVGGLVFGLTALTSSDDAGAIRHAPPAFVTLPAHVSLPAKAKPPVTTTVPVTIPPTVPPTVIVTVPPTIPNA